MGTGVGSDLHKLIGGSKSGPNWWEHSPPINVTILLGTAVGKGVGSHLHNLIGSSKSGADWWEHSSTINVAIRLERAVGRVVRGYLLNQIRASMSGAVVQALSSHQCSHPTGKSSREAGKGGGGVEGLSAQSDQEGARAAQWYRYCLPSMWPGFKCQRQRLAPRRLFSAYFGFLLSPKTNNDKLLFDLERTDTFKWFLTNPKYCVGKHITTFKLQFRWFC